MLHAGYERAPLPPVRQESPSATPDASAEPPAKVKKQPAEQRDPFLDNAKYLTIVLVAIGHVWDPLRDDSRMAGALYFVLYAFHMPAFIIVSGYLSRSFEGKPRQIKRLVTGVLVPYVVFQTIYTLFMRWASDNPDREFHFQEPGFALWFLVALFLWRLTTPLWKSMRWPVPVALAVAVAAGVTPSINSDLNLMRVAAFLPYFVLGLQLRPEHFQIVTRRRFRMLALPAFAGALLVAYWAVPRMSKGWFLHDKASQELGAPRMGRRCDDARRLRLRSGADGRVPGPGAAPEHVVHRPRRRNALRLPAARLPDQDLARVRVVRHGVGRPSP